MQLSPRLVLVDTLGSSEAIGMAKSVRLPGDSLSSTARFEVSALTEIISDDGRFVEPGSGEVGMVGFRGRSPVGYYKDEAKTAATFRIVRGERFSIPGDYARIEPDGTLTLLGRGSMCINTGGEKVFAEEVEETLKEHRAVRDAVVVGVPDERFGAAVVAVVELVEQVDEAELIEHVKGRLARYKAPTRVHVVASLDRAANGKLDIQRWQRHAVEQARSGAGEPV